VDSVEKEADQFGCGDLIECCHRARAIDRPSKSDQDRLDSTLCLLVAIRLASRAAPVLGDYPRSIERLHGCTSRLDRSSTARDGREDARCVG
jgi:hypothetical protein